jgi:hypothetical protein
LRSSMSLVALLVAICIGAVGGLLIRDWLFPHSRATASLRYSEDLQFFRTAETYFRSTVRLRVFAADWPNTSLDRTLIDVFERQLAAGGHGPIQIDHSYLTKRELRDVPDSLLKQLSSENSTIRVAATGADANTAVRLAALGVAFVRDTLCYAYLLDALRAWSSDVPEEIAKANKEVVELQSTINSLSRQLAAMQEVRKKYQDNALTGSAPQGVQVQVQGAKHLSPIQQIVGLESELISHREALKIQEQRLTRLHTLQHYAQSVDRDGKSGKAILDELSARAGALKTKPNTIAASEDLGSAGTLTLINEKLVGARAKFLDAPVVPATLQAEPVGPRKLWAILSGFVLGLIGWFAIIWFWALPPRDFILCRLRITSTQPG